MTDATTSYSDDTEALTVRPGLWPIWVGEGVYRRALWVVVGGFWIGEHYVPDGFVTDLASIPMWLHWVFNPFSPETAIPSAGHDLMLKAEVDERLAAAHFYVALRDWGVPRWKRQVYFWGVLFAARGW